MNNDPLQLSESTLDAILGSCKTPEDLHGESGLINQLTRHLAKRSASPVSPQSSEGVPAQGSAATPRRVWNQQMRLEDTILSMFSRGYSVREIQQQLQDLAGQKVSNTTITKITDATTEDMKAWLSRPLDYAYPIVYLDCIYIKIRDGSPRPKAVYVAIGITMEGQKEAIGVWVAQSEGAKFWRQVLADLHSRGLQDIFVVCVDGLKGFPESVAAVFPRSAVQLCIVHLVRRSLGFVMRRKQAEIAADLKRIYTSTTLEMAELRLGEFERRWGAEYPTIGQLWRKSWPEVTPLFDFPSEVRRIVYTTNIIESVNMSLRRVTAYRVFSSEEALLKLIFLALRNISKRWSRPIRDWKMAMRHFSIMFEERLP